MNIKKDILWRIYFSFFAITLVAVAILVQAFRVQVFEGEHYKSLADSLTTSFKTIPAERGNIFSEDGRLLATSLAFFEVRMDAAAEALNDDIFYKNVDSLALCMSKFFKDKSEREYRSKLINARKSGNRYMLIKRNVNFQDLQVMKSWPIFRLGRYKGGMIVQQTNKRQMPFGMLAHRTIGYVRTGAGAQSVGLEAEYDYALSGVNGKRLMQKIAGNNWMPINDKNEIEPKNGSDLITTIDVNIQDVAEYALLKALRKHNADHGSVIVMEVKTGKIKAIANLGKMGDDSYWEKYNYAIGEAIEPGSIFKLATMMALLEDKLIDLHDSIDIGYGQVWYSGQILRDSESHNHGKVTVQRSFEISSNVGMSKLAYQHYAKNPKKFTDHLQSFHLNDRTGIEIKGEGKPLVKSPGDKGWSRLSIPWMSVGYETLLTPLQSLVLYNAVANGGKMMKPYLVSEIKEFGKTIEQFEPEVIDDQICSEETIEKVKVLLEGVVQNGTARNLKDPHYKIAGKTGTAQIADPKLGYQKIYNASFAGYFPADDPQYSCIVVIMAPSNGVYYGGAVAGPVFKEISDKIFSNSLNMYPSVNEEDTIEPESKDLSFAGYQPDFQDVYKNLSVSFVPDTDNEWVLARQKQDSIQSMGLQVDKKVVPRVLGMGLKDALYLLENQGLQVTVSGKGKVVSQSLSPGSGYRRGEHINLVLN